MNTKILRRLSYVLLLFLPCGVNATLWSAGKGLLSSVFIASTFIKRPEASQICFYNRAQLKFSVNDYIARGRKSEAARKYGYPIDTWCVKNVKDMSYLFYFAKGFNENINNWDVSGVKDMSYMFGGTDIFNQNLSSWDVSNVVSMDHMFYDAVAFNGDIGAWNVSSVINMSYMFYNTASFNKCLNDWDVSNVVSMYGMFAWARAFNGDVSSWKLSNIIDMSYLFYRAKAFNQNLCAWGDEIDNDAVVTAMFFHSKCPERGCPDLRKSSPGPFCMNCNLTYPNECLIETAS